MFEIAARPAPLRELWRDVPLDVALSVFAVILAGALKWFGLMS